MKATHCQSVQVKDERGKCVLYWIKPLFGSLTVKNEENRIIIEKKGFFGSKTYFPSMMEAVETSK